MQLHGVLPGEMQTIWGNSVYRAETLVVKLAHSFAYRSLVVPVMSSHWAGAVPPTEGGKGRTLFQPSEECDESKSF